MNNIRVFPGFADLNECVVRNLHNSAQFQQFVHRFPIPGCGFHLELIFKKSIGQFGYSVSLRAIKVNFFANQEEFVGRTVQPPDVFQIWLQRLFTEKSNMQFFNVDALFPNKWVDQNAFFDLFLGPDEHRNLEMIFFFNGLPDPFRKL
jgi:hypothetical protein